MVVAAPWAAVFSHGSVGNGEDGLIDEQCKDCNRAAAGGGCEGRLPNRPTLVEGNKAQATQLLRPAPPSPRGSLYMQ